MEKQRLLYQQSRLHNRGAAEMVLQMISACKGETGCMVSSTLKLGISILNGGNSEVQQRNPPLIYSRELNRGPVELVLDLNAFERQNKAEGLGMVSEEGTSKSHSSPAHRAEHSPHHQNERTRHCLIRKSTLICT
ncbi:hypothetical protein NFI96_006541 [Prochilodus magdalenae]|nr:hypothetical protein NFI96_006541 [Prochilodus magdalenae]